MLNCCRIAVRSALDLVGQNSIARGGRMKTVMVIGSSLLGKGDDELGGRLMEALLRKVWASEIKPEVMLFYNSGVTLLAQESASLDALDGLSRAGVDLAACGTCVSHYRDGWQTGSGAG